MASVPMFGFLIELWNETVGHRGRKDDPLYRIRRLLTAASERISDRGRTRLRGLLDAGDPHGEVRTAWHAKETVRDIYGIDSPAVALRYTHPARRRPPRPILPVRDQQTRPDHQPLVPTDHELAHLEGDQQMPPKLSTTSSRGSNGQHSGYPTSRTTESARSSMPGNPTGTYSHRSLPREIRRARKLPEFDESGTKVRLYSPTVPPLQDHTRHAGNLPKGASKMPYMDTAKRLFGGGVGTRCCWGVV